jgi:ubiquitin-protein ligase
MYKGGMFRFKLEIPDNYPEQGPKVVFQTPLFHQLVDNNNVLDLASKFPVWMPRQHHICTVLEYIKVIIFILF